ncbi:hypothetical protein BBO99_00000845 [Phytophthora kernoviae]|uniref:Tudor domain-containing protein n=2 Tax=Phytophthora kernoviae TaxID=325452 RepID=A0A3R7MVN1_9STRA|nr:hypothetical protein G195_001562 [Phytophthora kernoviae 00238/432]KAG2531851.1 hypothetical protein JM16_000670 [Phytophthora kernoviae]KAG2532747.1 hypothetical protein JM18_000752 [Phytophthora kernoviae]RLN44382.1 hypothetical protein BBI17_000975 [Phytophthora kernoviae]RLN85007.1 hypothetical protein BBO99_00000845 [Phytophthora kernoviae]
MGAGASTDNSGEIVVGDVVTFQVENYPKRVIGLVADVQEDSCSIQVSNVEVLDGIPRNDVQRIAKWDEIEVGDKVKVKEQNSRLYYEAEVTSRNADGTYKVHFNEVDEEEDKVAEDRLLKLMSGRLEDKEWMMYKETEK